LVPQNETNLSMQVNRSGYDFLIFNINNNININIQIFHRCHVQNINNTWIQLIERCLFVCLFVCFWCVQMTSTFFPGRSPLYPLSNMTMTVNLTMDSPIVSWILEGNIVTIDVRDPTLRCPRSEW
jgi:hypothetical protein